MDNGNYPPNNRIYMSALMYLLTEWLHSLANHLCEGLGGRPVSYLEHNHSQLTWGREKKDMFIVANLVSLVNRFLFTQCGYYTGAKMHYPLVCILLNSSNELKMIH